MADKRRTGDTGADFRRMFQKLETSGDLELEAAKVEVAEQIYLAMRTQKISKAELARRLRSSRAYVTKILQGTANFTIESLSRIAFCLNSGWKFRMVSLESKNRRRSRQKQICVRESRRLKIKTPLIKA
jgi:transcriptional regulator with XRE-family HTH domain